MIEGAKTASRLRKNKSAYRDRTKIKWKIVDVINLIRTELNFNDEAKLIFKSVESGEAIPIDAVFIKHDGFQAIFNLLAAVHKNIAIGVLEAKIAAVLSKAVSAEIYSNGRRVRPRCPLKSLTSKRHNFDSILELRNCIANHFDFSEDVEISFKPFRSSEFAEGGVAVIGLASFLRSLPLMSGIKVLEKGLASRICIAGELQLLRAGRQMTGKIAELR